MAIGREVPGMEGHMPGGMTPEQRYYDLQKTRAMMAQQQAPSVIPQNTGAEALEDPTAPKAPTDTQQVSSMGKPSQIDEVADTLTAAGALNPKLAAAGLALKAFGMVDSAKRAQEQASIDAKNKKIMELRSVANRNLYA
jgi:hypothetical protein